jgi:hypothetical protein
MFDTFGKQDSFKSDQVKEIVLRSRIMKVAIIDADLIYRQNHRFPNLACMKISSCWKQQGADVELKLDYKNLNAYDLVSISKVKIIRKVRIRDSIML